MLACIDIGGTAIKVGVLDKSGNIYHKDELKVCHNIDDFTDNIFSWIENIMKEYEIEGIAISSPGAVDVESGIIGGKQRIGGRGSKEKKSEDHLLPSYNIKGFLYSPEVRTKGQINEALNKMTAFSRHVFTFHRRREEIQKCIVPLFEVWLTFL